MDYSKFTIKSGGLETISDLTKEECFESALNKIKRDREGGWYFCILPFNEYRIIYKELKEFLESNNYIVYVFTKVGFNGMELPYLRVDWVEED